MLLEITIYPETEHILLSQRIGVGFGFAKISMRIVGTIRTAYRILL